MNPLVSALIFILIVVLLVWAAIYVIDKTMPAEVHLPLKVVVGAIGLIAILYKLAPMAGLG